MEISNKLTIRMIDITSYLLKAKLNISSWNEKLMLSVADSILQTFQNTYLDWDKQDGELWAHIFHDKEVYALIRCDMPLVISTIDFPSILINEIEKKQVVIIPARDYETASFCLDLEKMLQEFSEWGDSIGYTENSTVSPVEFSASDLYYATHNSIITNESLIEENS